MCYSGGVWHEEPDPLQSTLTVHKEYRDLKDMTQIVLEDFNLGVAERRLCMTALALTDSLIESARLLGVTPSELKRLIIRLRIAWPQRIGSQGTSRAGET